MSSSDPIEYYASIGAGRPYSEVREIFGTAPGNIIGDLNELAQFNRERGWENGMAAIRAAALIAEMRDALSKCRDKFLHYEQLHRLKCTSEGDEKADRNRDMADMIDATLAKVQQ